MSTRSLNLLVVVLGACLLAACTSTNGPRIELSRDKIADRGRLELKGTGFTPKTTVISHMKRPDETEFPVLRFLTDDKGEFTHSIDTLTLLAGTHEVWVEDTNGDSSNVVKFEVLNEL